MDATLEAVVAELKARHGCHTVVLYGSRARGDWTEASDYDVLGVREGGTAVRDARAWRGSYLDAFVAPEEGLLQVGPEDLKLLGGRVLLERDGLGTRLLEAVAAYHRAGPPPLPAWDAELRRSWQRKTVERIRLGDIEGDYRRAMLLNQAPEDYFALRGRWYMGSKWAFQWLEANDPEAFAAFRAAMAPGAPWEAIAHLVEVIVAPQP